MSEPIAAARHLSTGGCNNPGMAEELLAIADELYALTLPDFTPARDAKAKELKGTDLAAEVKALKKPSLAGVGGQPPGAARDRAGRAGAAGRGGAARGAGVDVRRGAARADPAAARSSPRR